MYDWQVIYSMLFYFPKSVSNDFKFSCCEYCEWCDCYLVVLPVHGRLGSKRSSGEIRYNHATDRDFNSRRLRFHDVR